MDENFIYCQRASIREQTVGFSDQYRFSRRRFVLRTGDSKPEDILSVLKYIHTEYMSDEEYNKICDFDINDEKEQVEVIKTLIVPGFNEEFNDEGRIKIKRAIETSIQEKEISDNIFEMTSMPFQTEIEDKKGFLLNIYKELFGLGHIKNG